MATFVVATQKEQSVWVPDLESPQIQHALRSRMNKDEILRQMVLEG